MWIGNNTIAPVILPGLQDEDLNQLTDEDGNTLEAD